MYTFNESTRITRASGTWFCHHNYFQTIGTNPYMSDVIANLFTAGW